MVFGKLKKREKLSEIDLGEMYGLLVCLRTAGVQNILFSPPSVPVNTNTEF